MANPWGKPRSWDIGDKNLVTRGTGLSAFVGRHDRIPENPNCIKYRPGDWKHCSTTYGTGPRNTNKSSTTLCRSSSQGFINRMLINRSSSSSNVKQNALTKSQSLSRLSTTSGGLLISSTLDNQRNIDGTKSGIPRSRTSYKQIKTQAIAIRNNKKNQPVSTPFNRANSMKRRSRPPVAMNNMNVRANQVIRQSVNSPKPPPVSRPPPTSRYFNNSTPTTAHNKAKVLPIVRPNRASQLRRSKSEITSPKSSLLNSWSSHSLPRKSSLNLKKGGKTLLPQRRPSYEYSDFSASFSMDLDDDSPTAYSFVFTDSLSPTLPSSPPYHELRERIRTADRSIIKLPSHRQLSSERVQSITRLKNIFSRQRSLPSAKQLIKFYRDPWMKPKPQLAIQPPSTKTSTSYHSKTESTRPIFSSWSDESSSVMSFSEFERRKNEDQNKAYISDNTLSEGTGLSESSSSLELQVDRVFQALKAPQKVPIVRKLSKSSEDDSGDIKSSGSYRLKEKLPEIASKKYPKVEVPKGKDPDTTDQDDLLDIQELVKNTDFNWEFIKNPPPSSASDDSKEINLIDESEAKLASSSCKVTNTDCSSDVLNQNKNQSVVEDCSELSYHNKNNSSVEHASIKTESRLISKQNDSIVLEKVTKKDEETVSNTDSAQCDIINNEVETESNPKKRLIPTFTSSSDNAKTSSGSSSVPQKRRKSVQELLKFYEKKSTSSAGSHDKTDLSTISSSVISENNEMDVIAELEAIVRDEEKKDHIVGEPHEKLIPVNQLTQDLKLVSDLSSESWSDISSEKLRGTFSRQIGQLTHPPFNETVVKPTMTMDTPHINTYSSSVSSNKSRSSQNCLNNTYTKTEFKLIRSRRTSSDLEKVVNRSKGDSALKRRETRNSVAYTYSFDQEEANSDNDSNYLYKSCSNSTSYYSDSEISTSTETDESSRYRIKSSPSFGHLKPVRPVRTSFSQQTIRLLEQRKKDTDSNGSSDSRLASTVEQVLAKSSQMFNGLMGKSSGTD